MRNQEMSESIEVMKVAPKASSKGAVVYSDAFALKKKKSDHEIATQQILERAKKTHW